MPTITYPNVVLGTFGKADIILGDATIEVLIKVFWDVNENVRAFSPEFTTDKFMALWQEKVSAQWDDRFRMAPVAEPLRVRTVKFRLATVGSLADAHMPVYILNGNYAANGGVAFPTPKFFGGDRMYLRLNAGDNRSYSEGQADAISKGTVVAFKEKFETEINRVKEVVRAVLGGDGPMDLVLDRNGNAWSVAEGSKVRLNLLCEALQATPNYYPQPAVKLTVTSGLTEKGQTLAATVRAYMQGRGVHLPTIVNNVVKTGRKFHMPFSGHKAHATAQLEILDAGAMYRNVRAGVAMGDYCVSAHEFGHLFGLPDEYLDYSTFSNEIIKGSQPLWDTLCDRHDPAIPKRNWKSAFNESVMSIGTQVYKCHGTTIWDAVERKTDAKWRITQPA